MRTYQVNFKDGVTKFVRAEGFTAHEDHITFHDGHHVVARFPANSVITFDEVGENGAVPAPLEDGGMENMTPVGTPP